MRDTTADLGSLRLRYAHVMAGRQRRCYQKETGIYRPERLTISYILESQDLLREFFAECGAIYLNLIRQQDIYL